jgi:hypothetical protein
VESTFKSSHSMSETKKQWRNHGSEKTSNHARISCARMV